MVLIEPTVSSSVKKKDISPIIIDFTGHMGYHNSGWKSEIVRQIFFLGSNLPVDVTIMIAGGFIGYAYGN